MRGVFSTRIAYVLKQGSTYELQVADADGQNPQVALRSRETDHLAALVARRLCAWRTSASSPASRWCMCIPWPPAPGYRWRTTGGNSSAPAWSPDGSMLAIVLTRDGLSQIYTINADGSNLRRVTRSPGIDTEPTFTPDGRSIIFTSDRSGGPQIYQVGLGGGEPRRLTFNGSYNVSPRISPDGSTLVYVARRDGAFRIASLNLSSGTELWLTNGNDDQSPSFASNGNASTLYAAIQADVMFLQSYRAMAACGKRCRY